MGFAQGQRINFLFWKPGEEIISRFCRVNVITKSRDGVEVVELTADDGFPGNWVLINEDREYNLDSVGHPPKVCLGNNVALQSSEGYLLWHEGNPLVVITSSTVQYCGACADESF